MGLSQVVQSLGIQSYPSNLETVCASSTLRNPCDRNLLIQLEQKSRIIYPLSNKD